MPQLTLNDMRQHAVARTLFAPTTLAQAIRRLGFVQADPIRAPARAQDLTLRHRVAAYRAGDLESRYARLPIEEDFFVNYGFLPRATHALMHPRTPHTAWPAERQRQAAAVLDFVRGQGVVHPRQVDAQFQHGKARNWFGGSSNASTQLLDAMHFCGQLRIARREGGVRLYAASRHADTATEPQAAMDQLADVVLQAYAPLPLASFSMLVHRTGIGAPQWRGLCKPTVLRARARHPQALVDGSTWLWPAGENPGARRHASRADDGQLRLLAPFDPIVWDRRRFELLWRWPYRFEAYTPAPKRLRGYYALPLLWRGQVIGWANLSMQGGVLVPTLGYVAGAAPADAAYAVALDDELGRMAQFLGLG